MEPFPFMEDTPSRSAPKGKDIAMIRLRSALRLLAITGLLVFSGFDLASSSAGPIVCSCSFCKANPAVECQIGPGDGYSTLCSNYLQLQHC